MYKCFYPIVLTYSVGFDAQDVGCAGKIAGYIRVHERCDDPGAGLVGEKSDVSVVNE